MTKTFKFNDEAMCPECGKSLDDCAARDFIVFLMNGEVSPSPQEHQCGWCDAWLTVTPNVIDNTIVFKNKY